MLNKLLNWFRRPKWEEFRDEPVIEGNVFHKPDQVIYTNNPAMVEFAIPQDPTHFGVEQWRTNFSLTAAQRSERSRKAAATRKANKARRSMAEAIVVFEAKSNGE